jgi:hypothetical protein
VCYTLRWALASTQGVQGRRDTNILFFMNFCKVFRPGQGVISQSESRSMRSRYIVADSCSGFLDAIGIAASTLLAHSIGENEVKTR